MYQCTFCSYWARSVSNFHQHLVAHEKTPAFKCSNCDFSARYRTKITRHIQKSLKSTHETARWIMIKSLPEDQYSQYVKKVLIPNDKYCGNSPVQTVATPENTTSDSDGSREWLPSSNASSGNMEDCYSSSLSVVTPASSTDEEKPSSPSYLLTSSEEKSSRGESSPGPTTSKIVKSKIKLPNYLS